MQRAGVPQFTLPDGNALFIRQDPAKNKRSPLAAKGPAQVISVDITAQPCRLMTNKPRSPACPCHQNSLKMPRFWKVRIMLLSFGDGPGEVIDNVRFYLGLGLEDVWMAALGAKRTLRD